jgi:hypothetical protein
MMQRCEPCGEGLHRKCTRGWKCGCPICTYQQGTQLGHQLWRIHATRARVELLRLYGNRLIHIEPRELTGYWRRRGDRYCAPYRIEEHVPGVRDAELLLQEADGGPHTLRIKLSYLRSFWDLLAE